MLLVMYPILTTQKHNRIKDARECLKRFMIAAVDVGANIIVGGGMLCAAWTLKNFQIGVP